MTLGSFVSATYEVLRTRRLALLALTALAIGLGAARFLSVPLEQDIEAMLPDRGSGAAADYRLLARAPFSRSVVLSVESDGAAEPGELGAAMDRLAAGLDPELFPKVTVGPDLAAGARLLPWLAAHLPELATPEDLAELTRDLTPQAVAERLAEQVALLHSPEGMVLKGLVRADPLSLRLLAARDLRHLALVPGARLEGGHFVSADGSSALAVAETPVPITDAAGSERLYAAFRAAAAELPAGFMARLVSGHRYTLANSRAIQGDLTTVFAISLVALGAIFGLFLRHWRAGYVFLVPVAAVCVGGLAVSLAFPTVSAITVGFGAVLLGITVDYALHVFFALRAGGAAPADLLARLARPVLFGGLTTAGAFGVLLSSHLPGQRQMAVFSLGGIAAALVLSLVVLPHLIPAAAPDRSPAPGVRPRRRRFAAWLWVLALAALATQLGQVRFNGNLRDVGVVTPELAADEAALQRTWGNFRGKALLFADGPTEQAALERNDTLYRFLVERYPEATVVSLAPLVPAEATQALNHRDWQRFWRGADGKRVLAALTAAGREQGFAESAFAPFVTTVHRELSTIRPGDLDALGLGAARDALLFPVEGTAHALTLVPDEADLLAAVGAAFPDVHRVSPAGFNAGLGEAIRADFARFLALASVAVVALLALLLRDLKRIGLALVPVVTAVAAMAGAMAALDQAFNLFNIVAATLVIGLSVDYGLFVVCAGAEGATRRAVLTSGLTTLAGFGALALAQHPALRSIGVSVLLGIGAALPAALFVIPALGGDECR